MELGIVFGVFGFFLLIVIAVVVGMIKTFNKMGYDDAWWLIIPILNFLFMLRVADKPWWWLLLMFIPYAGGIVSIYIGWLVASRVSKAYGKTDAYAIGLLLLGFIFYPMLGFSAEQPQVSA